MSKWVDFRDEIVKSVKLDAVTEQVKQNVMNAILAEGIPFIEATAQAFTAKLQEQAKNESGWCAIRDRFVIPMAFSVGLFAVKNILEITAKNIK
jgi:hypothetical protein|nr:MAG TPA: hypothetical protein [Caudoviricetes sp.]